MRAKKIPIRIQIEAVLDQVPNANEVLVHTWREVRAYRLYIDGELFGVHQEWNSKDKWQVTHVDTGMRVTAAERTMRGAINRAKRVIAKAKASGLYEDRMRWAKQHILDNYHTYPITEV
jgi:hypothetical protein